MVHIYTFCDKTLIGRKENLSAKLLCEYLYKQNLMISEANIYGNSFDFASLNFKNKDVYFLLLQKSSHHLNSVLANLCNTELSENVSLKNAVKEYYRTCNVPINKESEMEWLIPQNATAITNPNGKTQGYTIKISGSEIFVLPNEYLEFKKIFNDCLQDYIATNHPSKYNHETYKLFGLSEHHIRSVIKDQIKNKDGVSVSIFSKGLCSDVVIKSKEENANFENYRREIYSKLEKYIYSVQDLNLVEHLNNLIKSQNVKFSVAGNMPVIKMLTNLENNVFNHNLIRAELITNEIEISSDNAYQSAVNMLNSDTDLVLAVLTDMKPDQKGQTYIAIGNKLKIDIYKNQFNGTEDEIVQNVSDTAIFYLIKKIASKDYKTI